MDDQYTCGEPGCIICSAQSEALSNEENAAVAETEGGDLTDVDLRVMAVDTTAQIIASGLDFDKVLRNARTLYGFFASAEDQKLGIPPITLIPLPAELQEV